MLDRWPWSVRALNVLWLRTGWDRLRQLCAWRMRRVAQSRKGANDA